MNVNVVPFPFLLSTEIFPPNSSIACCDMFRPSPVPRYSLVSVGCAWKNFVNIFVRLSFEIPIPVSFTFMIIFLSWV